MVHFHVVNLNMALQEPPNLTKHELQVCSMASFEPCKSFVLCQSSKAALSVSSVLQTAANRHLSTGSKDVGMQLSGMHN